MQLAERLGMTLAQMNKEMSHVEFQMWMALDTIRAEECPSCGYRADAMLEVEKLDVACPICAHEYFRVRPYRSPWQH